jgi:alpha 1,2-mannosyltransferase
LSQWSTTPWNKRHDLNYHPEPAFLHTILAKHRRGLQPDKLFSHLRRPRIDNISEPSLVRTPYDFTGDCFALTLKGPDGLASAENSMRDGQGVLTETVESVMGGLENPTYVALRDLAQTFVDINKDEH